jgi:hypothetical protein
MIVGCVSSALDRAGDRVAFSMANAAPISTTRTKPMRAGHAIGRPSSNASRRAAATYHSPPVIAAGATVPIAVPRSRSTISM